ncbi:MAG: hypothetical protein CAF41_007805 [Nitrospira sp. CG24A]|nr:MAG: hypothetical protein CAF41_007805 [Nitrospira sp. CG24A]
MESTWASGAIELLKHADSHVSLSSAFDRRIAFISVDNAVETMIRVFLSLPKGKSGVSVPRKDFDEAENSFPKLLALLWTHGSSRLTGLDDSDIEHYHRIRNKLYHDGTGLSVDEQYLLAYRQIASLLLQRLFAVASPSPRPAATLEHLIVLWNRIEEVLKRKLDSAGIDRGHTYYWEEAKMRGILSMEDISSLTELRMIRNKQVHSTSIDAKQVEYAIDVATRLLHRIDG